MQCCLSLHRAYPLPHCATVQVPSRSDIALGFSILPLPHFQHEVLVEPHVTQSVAAQVPTLHIYPSCIFMESGQAPVYSVNLPKVLNLEPAVSEAWHEPMFPLLILIQSLHSLQTRQEVLALSSHSPHVASHSTERLHTRLIASYFTFPVALNGHVPINV